jgi:hypothetical protein
MKWVLIIIGGIVGVLVLLGGVGYYFLSKPIDPNSDVGQEYAKGFKSAFVENCLEQANATAADPATQQQIQSACECGAEASYQELKDVPLTEQYSRLQEPECSRRWERSCKGACRTPGSSESRESVMAGIRAVLRWM